jgi:diguanylate cyclase (GGDEF)-like protein
LTKNIFKLDSIRSRYVFAAALLSILFLASVWFSQIFVSSAVKETAKNSISRNNVLDSHRVIRDALRQADYQIQAYLVTPDKKEYQQVLEQLDKAIYVVDSLLNDSWVKESNQQKQIILLSAKLINFKNLAKKVMNIRITPEDLFPAYGIINNEMLPYNVQFSTHINLALDDVSSRLSEVEIQKIYHEFGSLKDTWNYMIGSFRMYMASKAMSLKDMEEGNGKYESVIELYHQSLQKKLVALSSIQNDYDFGIQVEEALQSLGRISNGWYQSYLKTKTIYSSKNWRIDESIMGNEIKPLNEEIWILLNSFELRLAKSYEKDTNNLAEIASNVNSVLWLRMLIALGFIIVVFLAFELWVLKPVSLIARAIKAEADGEEVDYLPEPNTLETRELIEAFDEMRSQVRMRQLELEHKAMHDVLTGLPNRLLLRRQLIQCLEEAKKTNGELALLMIDLNKFKEINDTLGHHMGDRVLREIGPRFISELDSDDVLARLGGDEFAVLLPNSSAERANEVAKKLNRSLDINFNMDGQKLRVGSSIGIALFPHHGLNEQSLLQRADVAMYLAKHKGLSYLVYDESQDEQSAWQLSFKGELERAIKEDILELYYQPRISLKSNTVTGFEALLRWHHSKHDLIPADETHLLAEKTGLIKPLTKWVVNTAVYQLSEWLKEGLDLNISINLSVWNLQDQKLFDCVKDALRRWNVPANKLILEIAESAIMSDPDSALLALEQLSQLGVKISIDDFGIGFSSLHYLKNLPINELKIDKSFVMDLIVDENDAVIVRSSINLAHDLGLNVLAEGVESQEIYELIQILGCDDAQGYHMAHAMPAKQIINWMSESKWGLKPSSHLTLIK